MKLEFPPNWKVERHVRPVSALHLFHDSVYYVRHAYTDRLVRWNSRDHRKGKMARTIKPGSVSINIEWHNFRAMPKLNGDLILLH